MPPQSILLCSYMHFKASPSGPSSDGALEARGQPGHEVFVARGRGEICKIAMIQLTGGQGREQVR